MAKKSSVEFTLQQCTVRIYCKQTGKHGTGFFVAPKKILTCAHVIEGEDANLHCSEIYVRWQDFEFQAIVEHFYPGEYPDLALLTFNQDFPHEVLYFDDELNNGDRLLSYGFSYGENYKSDSALFTYEGTSNDDEPLLRLGHSQAQAGMSGAALFNLNTQRVNGVLKKTRDSDSDLGGRGISYVVISRFFPELINTHKHNIITILREHLAQINNQISAFKDNHNIPVDLGEQKKYFEERIVALELHHEQANPPIDKTIQDAQIIQSALLDAGKKLSRHDLNENLLDIDKYFYLIDQNLNELFELQKTVQDQSKIFAKQQTLLFCLQDANKMLAKSKQVIDMLEKNSVSSIYAFSSLPVPTDFKDRIEAVEGIKEHFNNYRIFVIAGFGGIGKTYFTRKVLAELKCDSALWIECNQSMTFTNFFEALLKAKLFSASIKRRASLVLSENPRLNENRVKKLLELIDQPGICIVLDDFQYVNDTFEQIIEWIDVYTTKLKIFVLTRRRTRSLESVYFNTYCQDLEGIDVNMMKEYLEGFRLYVDTETAQRIYSATNGHPMAIKLFASLCRTGISLDPNELLSNMIGVWGQRLTVDIILKKVDNDLSDKEEQFLAEFSAFRRPVNVKAIFEIFTDDCQVVFYSLIHRFLITEPLEHEFQTHDLIKNYFYKRLSNPQIIHGRIGQWYYQKAQENKNTDYFIEAFFHLYEAKDYNTCIHISDLIFSALEAESRYEVILKLITKLEESGTPLPDRLIIFKAIVYEVYGYWDKALEIVEKYIDKTEGAPKTLIEAINIAFHIYEQKASVEQALYLYNSYKEIIDTQQDSPQLAHLYHRLARLYTLQANLDELSDYFSKSLKIAKAIGDELNQARTLREFGAAMWLFGKYDNAMDYLKEALLICKKGHYSRELSDTFKHIGVVYHLKKDYESAVFNIDQAITISKRIGYKHGLAWAQYAKANTLIRMRKTQEAEKLLAESIELFDYLGELNGVVKVYNALGKIELEFKNFNDALGYFSKGIELSRTLKNPLAEGMLIELEASIYEEQGKDELRMKSLIKARDIYIEIESSRKDIVSDKISKAIK